MLISLSGLVDKTTLYSIKRFFLSKDNDKMGFKSLFLFARFVYIELCYARANHVIIILKKGFRLTTGQVCVIYSCFSRL